MMKGKEFTKDELLKMVTWNNAAFWCGVVAFFGGFLIQTLGFLGYAIAGIAGILWQIDYCKLAFKSDSAIAKIAWIIQIVACVIAFCTGFSIPVVSCVWGVAGLTLVIAIYLFFKNKGLKATFITYISSAACEEFKNSVK